MSSAAGHRVETQALAYLQERGARLVARNYRSRGGEIDLIVTLDQLLIFAEVRFRQSARFGSAAESVDRRKQERLAATAQHFLQCHPGLQHRRCRFDVLACRPGAASLDIQWIPDAFQP